MTWRPYEPQKPEFRYKVVKRTIVEQVLDREPKFEVYANGFPIGHVYSLRGGYALSPASSKSYTIEEISEKLWDRYRNIQSDGWVQNKRNKTLT